MRFIALPVAIAMLVALSPSPVALARPLDDLDADCVVDSGCASEVTWQITIPGLGVETAVVPVGRTVDNAMGTPEAPDVVGWFREGPAPGQGGNVLLVGHVDWTNRQTGVPFPGVFWRLRSLPPGSLVTIDDGAAVHRYTVAEHRRYRWDDPAGNSVLLKTTDERLTLITCGGYFDQATRNYSMRDIVIATRVDD